MRVPFKIGEKEFLIKPYTTFEEKEILLLSSFDVDDLDRVFEILDFNTEHELSIEEQKVILYKHREISLGDEIDIKFKCEACKKGNDAVLEANNFAMNGKRNDPDVKKINKSVTDDNLSDFVDIDSDELDIEEFEGLKQRVIDNQVQFNFVKDARCLHCGEPKKFDLGDTKYIIEIMSEDTLMTLYKSYNHLIYFGNYSKADIDKMYPFERSIFIGLLNKTKEDLAK